jgi:hypothetical protein
MLDCDMFVCYRGGGIGHIAMAQVIDNSKAFVDAIPEEPELEAGNESQLDGRIGNDDHTDWGHSNDGIPDVTEEPQIGIGSLSDRTEEDDDEDYAAL